MSNNAVQLALYNEALALMGARKLASLSEAVESRRLLDSIWDTNVVDTCLELGQWNFAARIASLTYAPSIDPSFGYQYAFTKPDDLVVLMKLCSDEYLETPLLKYQDTAQFWFAAVDTIYLQYVSNDGAYGNDFSLWPESFKRYVAAYLALHAVPRLSRDKSALAYIEGEMKKRLATALNKDAMKEPTRFAPQSSWQAARRRGRTERA